MKRNLLYIVNIRSLTGEIETYEALSGNIQMLPYTSMVRIVTTDNEVIITDATNVRATSYLKEGDTLGKWSGVFPEVREEQINHG